MASIKKIKHFFKEAKHSRRNAKRFDRYHQPFISEANHILRNIESVSGKLPVRDIKLSNEYAVEVLGHKHFSAWLYVYSAVAGGFKEGWIPDNYYGSIVIPNTAGAYEVISSLKPLNSMVFKSELFPDVASYVNGVFLSSAYGLIPDNDVKDVIFCENERVVYKLDNSSQGRGIYFFEKDNFSIEKIKSLGNGLFQGYIYQHQLFNEFADNSVATLRITSVFNNEGDVSIRACYLKFGSGNDTHVQAGRGVIIPIDLNSGVFNDSGYLAANWLCTSSHPTSKVPFKGNVVPSFLTCLETAKSLHMKIPFARCVGWDMTVDVGGNVKVIECNVGHNGIKFSEATQGPCFSDLGWEKYKLFS